MRLAKFGLELSEDKCAFSESTVNTGDFVARLPLLCPK
jgi:hypothetical protein